MAISKLYFFIIEKFMEFDLDETTYYHNIEIMEMVPGILEEFKKIENDEADQCKSFYNNAGVLEYNQFSIFLKVGDEYWFSVDTLRENTEKHPTLLSLINREEFLYKRAFHALKDFLKNIKSKQSYYKCDLTNM